MKLDHVLHDYHVHLYGVLSPEDIFELGKDRYQDLALQNRIQWCEENFSRVVGRPMQIKNYWQRSDGYDLLCRDYLMVDAGNFEIFQAKFNLLIALFGILDPDDLHVARHVFTQQMQAGIRGAEYRMVAPSSLSRAEQLRFFNGLCGLAEEFHQISEGTYQPYLALSLARDEQLGAGDFALAQELKHGPFGQYLRAIDFCQAEAGHPPAGKAALIQQVLAQNQADPDHALLILYHVGETFSEMTVMSSVRWVLEAALLGCHRLGHCLSLGVDPMTLRHKIAHEPVAERLDHLIFLQSFNDRWLAKMQVNRRDLAVELSQLQTMPTNSQVELPYDDRCLGEIKVLQEYVMERIKSETEALIEVCPSSNLRIGTLDDLSKHPIWRFREAGLRTVIGSDDPGLFATNLKREKSLVQKHHGE